MSRSATNCRRLAVIAWMAGAAWGQSIPAAGPSSEASNFRRLGLPSIADSLAGPSTGAVEAVWYSPQGGTLFVRTASGQVFQTADFENWTRSDATRADAPSVFVPSRQAEPNARVIFAPGDSRRLWSLGRDLSVSEDNGASWTNISGSGEPVIGAGQRDLAVNPAESSSIAVANDSGVWQSPDSGQSWAALNENLPNLPISRILSTATGALRIALEDGRTLQFAGIRSPWTVATAENILIADTRERQRLQALLKAEITAVAHSGDYAYAGSSDGRLWTSRDRGVTWSLPQSASRGSVNRIVIDTESPRAALALLSGPGGHILRTVNAGAVWDDVTGNLGDVNVNGIAADRLSGAAYVATDRGVYSAHVDLNSFVAPSVWTPVSDSLPPARAVDVALDPHGRQLFVALEGYGLYAATLSGRGGALRLINAADLSGRAAAPGSLISVLGGKVTAARAGGLTFPVLAAADSESQIQVPFEALPATVDLAIDSARKSAVLPLAIHSVSPAIFVDPNGSPFLVDADSGLALDAASAAHPNARLQLMATGLGRVQPDWQTGVPAPSENPPTVVSSVKAYLDGIPLEVTRATLAPGYIGYYLVEIQLPAIINAGSAELYLVADGQESNRVRLQIDLPNTATE